MGIQPKYFYVNYKLKPISSLPCQYNPNTVRPTSLSLTVQKFPNFGLFCGLTMVCVWGGGVSGGDEMRSIQYISYISTLPWLALFIKYLPCLLHCSSARKTSPKWQYFGGEYLFRKCMHKNLRTLHSQDLMQFISSSLPQHNSYKRTNKLSAVISQTIIHTYKTPDFLADWLKTGNLLHNCAFPILD